MKIDEISRSLISMGVISEYFGGFSQSKNSIKRGVKIKGYLPQFKKCESCGYEVVVDEIDDTGICNDCRTVA